MTQTSPAVMEDCLPVIDIPGVGPVVFLPTTRGIKAGEGVTLQAVLAGMNAQIVANAAAVARIQADLADIRVWLTERHGYVPGAHETGDSYLVPLYAAIAKVPTGTATLPSSTGKDTP